jgi:peptidoglycan/LPS O-acetylase OafA/YrhL
MRLEKLCVGAIFALGIVLNGVQIVIDHVLRLDMSGSLSWLYSSMCDHAHGLLGIMLFVLLKRIFDSLFSRGVPKGAIRVLSVSDAYSYDVYLVHQFMILGPFTLMELTPYLGLNILLILTGTCVLAWVVHGISDRARQGVQRLLNRAWTAAESMEGQA